jgi:glutamyl-tRNA synthetase
VARVRFAPSPTGPLHVGGALVAAANRRFADERGGTMLLRIDDTDPDRTVPDGEDAIVADLEWLGLRWDEGPVRQSERQARHREAARALGVDRFDGYTLLREDGSATYHLASVVDDVDFGITHVIRGSDHRPNESLHRRLHEALGARAPEYLYVGLVLRPDGGKLSKRDPFGTVAALREAGIPAAAVSAYLDELGIPRHDVRLDVARIRRLAVDAIARMADDELARAVGVPVDLAPALRGARDLADARDLAQVVLEPGDTQPPASAGPSLRRFRALREAADGALDDDAARALIATLREEGTDLRALRLALTGRDRGPELWSVLRALGRDEALRRVDAALAR